MSNAEQLTFNYRSIIDNKDYLQLLLGLNLYHNRIEESWLNDLHGSCSLSLHRFSIYHKNWSSNCSGGRAIIVNMNCFRFNFSYLQLDGSALRRCAKHLNEYNYVCVINIYVTPDCIQSSLSVFVDEFTEFAVPTFSS